jgi:hypothetical protein
MACTLTKMDPSMLNKTDPPTAREFVAGASGDLILFFSWRFKNADTILHHFLP